jgi:hypothetical protein
MCLGIFGAPTFIVDGELFWGNDRLEAALDWAMRTPAASAADVLEREPERGRDT